MCLQNLRRISTTLTLLIKVNRLFDFCNRACYSQPINIYTLKLFVKPSIALNLKRSAVLKAANRFRAVNPRVFGSVLHGTDKDGSDLDLLVDVLPGTTLFDLGGLQAELEELLGVHVDLLTPSDLPAKFRNQVLTEAKPI